MGDAQHQSVGEVNADFFRSRATQLLAEQRLVTKAASALWDIRCIGTILEYCSCLWLKMGNDGTASPVAKVHSDGRCPSEGSRTWVAFEVLSQEPFECPLADVAAFYGEMLAHLTSWLQDLQAAISPIVGARFRPLSEQDLHVHLAEVAIAVLD